MINLDLYPIVNSEWVIRGTQEIPRLYNIYNNKVVKLNREVLEYISSCDGTKNFRELQNYFNVPIEIVEKFYSQFISQGIIDLSNKKTLSEVDVSLGLKEPWLKEVHLDITNNCNLRCRHCFWGENLGVDKNTPLNNWLSLIDNLKDNGVGRIVISGGEALTNPDLFQIVQKCYEKRIMISSIFTNGTIYNSFTKRIIDFITEKDLTTTFYISLDGMNAEQHDFIRGNGNFEKTLFFIRELVSKKNTLKAKYKILINSLIHKKNYHNLIPWYKFLNNLGVDGWRFTTGRASGFLKENADEIKISSEECFNQYMELIEYIIQQHRANVKTLYVNVENFFNGHMLETGKAYIFDKDLPICDYKSQACSIDPKGNVQFCTGWQTVKYGNAFDEDISEIWYSEKMRKMKEFKIREIKECQNCQYLNLCGGGCRLECKDIYAKDDVICESFKLFEKYIVPILKNNNITFSI